MSLVNWNVEWATPRSRRTPEIRKRIDAYAPDIVCLTETHNELLSPEGHVICSQPDYGYEPRENRRKVMLWSREPWKRVDDLGHKSMPPGRYVSGITRTPLGEVTVIGICIPWSGCRTEARRGAERKKRWEDHESYIKCLSVLLRSLADRPLIIAGDFNQGIGQGRSVPHRLRAALQDSIPAHLTIATSALGHRGRRSIDHIALSEELTAESLTVISNMDDDRKLSDHFGISASLSLQNSKSLS